MIHILIKVQNVLVKHLSTCSVLQVILRIRKKAMTGRIYKFYKSSTDMHDEWLVKAQPLQGRDSLYMALLADYQFSLSASFQLHNNKDVSKINKGISP